MQVEEGKDAGSNLQFGKTNQTEPNRDKWRFRLIIWKMLRWKGSLSANSSYRAVEVAEVAADQNDMPAVTQTDFEHAKEVHDADSPGMKNKHNLKD